MIPRPVSAPDPTPADGGTAPARAPREALAIAALALGAFSLSLNTNVLGPLLPFLRVEVPLAGDDGKHLIAAAAFGSAGGALAFDRLARRHGRRGVLLFGFAVFVLASLMHLVPGGVPWLLVVRALAGAAVGLAYAAASALAASLTPYARRGGAMGRFNAGLFLAVPVGMPLAVLVATAGWWPAIFAVQAVVAVTGWWWARAAVPAEPAEPARPALLPVLANRGATAGLLATALHVGSFFTTVQLAGDWLDRTGRVAKEDQLWIWVALGVASVAGSSVFGRVSDAVGKRNFVLVTSAVLVGSLLLLAREPGPLLLAAGGFVLAVTAAARTGPLQALLSGQVPREQLNALMSWRGCVMQLGVGGFAVGAVPIADRAGFRGVLLLAAGCQAASYLLIRFGCREGR
jgi:predicted MFS family arabinose efflux permease